MKMKRCIYFLGILVIALSLTVCDNGFLKNWQNDDDDTSVSTTAPTPTPAPGTPPSIISAGGTTITSSLVGGSFPVLATGDLPITYSLSGHPSGVDIDPLNNLTFNTVQGAASPYTFTITATNSADTYTQVFSLTVTDVPSAPSITIPTTFPTGTLNIPYPDQYLGVNVTPVTWAIFGQPAGLSLTSAGVITGTPTAFGTFTVTVTATNSVNTDLKTFTLTVTNKP